MEGNSRGKIQKGKGLSLSQITIRFHRRRRGRKGIISRYKRKKGKEKEKKKKKFHTYIQTNKPQVSCASLSFFLRHCCCWRLIFCFSTSAVRFDLVGFGKRICGFICGWLCFRWKSWWFCFLILQVTETLALIYMCLFVCLYRVVLLFGLPEKR